MNAPRLPGADDLDAALADALARLARGVADRRSPFHSPTIATIGLDGRPRARTVVLRALDAPARTLRFHCDGRSAKAAELARDSRAALHAYDGGSKIQVRAEGRAVLHAAGPVADAAWAASRPESLATYGVEPGPGTPMASGGAYSVPAGPTPEGRAHFVAVALTFDHLEWLLLAHDGHRRAAFAWDEGGALAASWLTP